MNPGLRAVRREYLRRYCPPSGVVSWRDLPAPVRRRIQVWEFGLHLTLTVKRILDLLAALGLLLLLSPLLLLVGFCNVVLLGWPPLACDLCCGEDGSVFQRWRFRVELENLSPLIPLSTRLPGRGEDGLGWRRRMRLAYSGCLQALRLDRLPILLNLLVGDLALWGPPAVLYSDFLLTEPALHGDRGTRPGLFLRDPVLNQQVFVPRRANPLWLDYVDNLGFGATVGRLLRMVPTVLLGRSGCAAEVPAVECVMPAGGVPARFVNAADDLLRRLLGWVLALGLGLAQVVPFLLLYPCVRVFNRGMFAAVAVAGRSWQSVPVQQFMANTHEQRFLTGLFRACLLDKFPQLGEVFIGPLWFCGQNPLPITEGQPLLELTAAYLPGVFYREPSGAEPGGKLLYPGLRDEDYAAEKSTLTDLSIFLRLLLTRPARFLAGI